MKRISLLLFSLLLVNVCGAQVDSVKMTNIEGKIAGLESSINAVEVQQGVLRGEIQSISANISTLQPQFEQRLLDLEGVVSSQGALLKTLKGQVGAMQSDIAQVRGQMDRLGGRIDTNTQQIVSTSSDLDAKILATDNNARAQASELTTRADGVEAAIKSKSLWGIIVLVIAFVISITLCVILHLKGKKSLESLKQSAEKLNEEIINKASVEVSEMQKIANSIGALPSAGVSSDSEQQLIKTLADRITFMEMTLYKMDSSVRGHKQLAKSIAQMKDNMLANGYEIVDMLGKPYHEGMKVTANFVEDEDLEQGKQIITGIIKPQINYRGEMIQAAQITVSQNI